MGSMHISAASGAGLRHERASPEAQAETKSLYEMLRDAREQAESQREKYRLPKNTRYGDAPLEAYARLARAKTQGEVSAASGFARRKILQLQSALRRDPDNKDCIRAAIRQLQKAVTRAGKKKNDLQREKLTDVRRKKAAKEKQRRKAQRLRQELYRTRALRSIRESGYIREAEMDNRIQEQLSAAKLELRAHLQELSADTGVSVEAALHQYAARMELGAEADIAGAGLDMLA